MEYNQGNAIGHNDMQVDHQDEITENTSLVTEMETLVDEVLMDRIEDVGRTMKTPFDDVVAVAKYGGDGRWVGVEVKRRSAITAIGRRVMLIMATVTVTDEVARMVEKYSYISRDGKSVNRVDFLVKDTGRRKRPATSDDMSDLLDLLV